MLEERHSVVPIGGHYSVVGPSREVIDGALNRGLMPDQSVVDSVVPVAVVVELVVGHGSVGDSLLPAVAVVVDEFCSPHLVYSFDGISIQSVDEWPHGPFVEIADGMLGHRIDK